MADTAAHELRQREHLVWLRRLELEHDNFWTALSNARDAGDAEVAVRLAAGLGWYFALANLASEGRTFIESALSIHAAGEPTPARIAAYAELCHLADVELDHRSAAQAGKIGLALSQRTTAARETARVQAALALAVLNAGDRTAAAQLLAEARARCEAIGDEWGLAGCELIAAMDALNEHDLEAAATAADRILRRAHAIEYAPFSIWALLLDGWSAEQRADGPAAMGAVYQRALDAANQLNLPHYVSFALAQLGSRTGAYDDLDRAERLLRRAAALAEGARMPWFAAHARVRLAATLAGKGELDAAEAQYRMVVDRMQDPTRRHGREAFFVALAGSPMALALNGLADLATPRDGSLRVGRRFSIAASTEAPAHLARP